MKLKFALMITLAGAAAAQTASPVSLNLVMSLVKTVKVDGKTTEQFAPSPKTVLPGDVIRQVVTVRNSGGRALKNVPVTLPVPKNTRYLAPEKGLDDVRAEFSIDQGKTFAAAPLMKKVTVTENGRSVVKEVEVKPSEYTTVRWTVSELGADQTLKLGYRIQVK
ncbi:hypothetical protein DEIGR_102875 [Deinococcus grandis]|uniref:DUF11 domain-containing protein n=1 Tax=Deinococcus grandis TaxID=57498 RepID=A0A100HLC3_9DEIO|nr:DUF11 domain-containing protein [Deinococcus grandis]BBN93642.1 hypothetical protein DEGR_03750 [Deinococcus grandis]GAQ22848.1 hypothetical protein DEIGR_102875 [Deinococcus grandis]